MSHDARSLAREAAVQAVAEAITTVSHALITPPYRVEQARELIAELRRSGYVLRRARPKGELG